MRTFRDSLKPSKSWMGILVALALSACRPSAESGAEAPQPSTSTPAADTQVVEESPASDDYFPLAVGNSWTYACLAEGEPQLGKRVEIVGTAIVNGQSGFRVDFSVDGEVSSQYLWEGSDRIIYRSLSEGDTAPEPLIARQPRLGDIYGVLRATRIADQETPATGPVRVLVLESFDADDPNLTESRRLEWRGQFYTNDIGLIAEADGLGNECVLTAYAVAHSDLGK